MHNSNEISGCVEDDSKRSEWMATPFYLLYCIYPTSTTGDDGHVKLQQFDVELIKPGEVFKLQDDDIDTGRLKIFLQSFCARQISTPSLLHWCSILSFHYFHS